MSDILVGWFNYRIKQNKNLIAVINGPTGSGKSWAALSLAEKGSKDNGTSFSIKNNVAFDFKELLEQTQRPENTKAGTYFVFEEVGSFGSGSSSREWQSQANKFFHSFLQTTRHRRQILLFTCPLFANLEAGARALCHMQILMDKIDFKAEKTKIIPYIIQVNNRTGKLYFKYLRYHEGHLRTRLLSTFVNKPSDTLIKEYEAKKLAFTTQLNATIMESLTPKPKAKIEKPINLEVIEVLKEKGYTHNKIAELLGCSKKTIQRRINGDNR